MVIAIDVGNTSVKVARVTHGEVGEVTRLPTTGEPGPEGLENLLDAGDASGAIALVSVVPAWTSAIAGIVARAPGLRLVPATHETIPLRVRLASPATVGPDRLLGAWTATRLVGAPCIVVDVGTATTIDAVDDTGAFVGGAILPGPALAVRSLARGTALLPPVPLEQPARAIGRDTLEAIASGVMLGHREAVGGLLRRMRDELGGRATAILTGGDAGVLGTPDWADRTEPHLLLRGLGALAALVAADPPVATRA